MRDEYTQQQAEKIAQTIKPTMDAITAALDNSSFKNAIASIQHTQSTLQKAFQTPYMQDILKGQMIAHEQIRSVMKSLENRNWEPYRNLLQSTFVNSHGLVDIYKPKKSVLETIELTFPEVEEVLEVEPDKEVAEIVKTVKQKRKKQKDVYVFFTSTGRLWCRDTKGNEKKVEFKSDNMLQLLRIFSLNQDYTKSDILLAEGGYSSSSALYNAIEKLRKKIEELGFDIGNPIVPKQGYGYRPHEKLFLQEK